MAKYTYCLRNGGNEMSQRLCSKCKNNMNEEGFMRARSWEHCHHPEEMKEKCWCDYPVDERNYYVGRFDKGEGYSSSWIIKFCPVCSKKL